MVAEPVQGPKSVTLPDGWRMVTFGEMAQSINDRVDNPAEAGVERYVGLEHLDPDTLHLHRWGLPTDVEATKLRFKPGDVIFGRRRAYQRKLAVADFEGICSAHALVLRARPETVDQRYLPVFMQSELFFKRALEISVGSLSPTINWKTLAVQPFPLPPKDEQRRIADILWAADAAVECWRDVAESLRIARVATEHELFRAEEAAASRTLGDVLEYGSDGPFGSKLKTAHYSHEGARVIRLQNLGDAEFLDDDKAFVPLNYFTDELARYAVRPGDVLVAGLGDDANPVGRACIAPAMLGAAVNKADCFCLRGKTGVIDNSYLCLALNSDPVRQQVLQKAQGTTRLRVNVSNLKTVKFPVPQLERQAEVLALLAPFASSAARVHASMSSVLTLRRKAREKLLLGTCNV